jgi:hypothetical protein
MKILVYAKIRENITHITIHRRSSDLFGISSFKCTLLTVFAGIVYKIVQNC